MSIAYINLHGMFGLSQPAHAMYINWPPPNLAMKPASFGAEGLPLMLMLLFAFDVGL